jgi:hypothetical protein
MGPVSAHVAQVTNQPNSTAASAYTAMTPVRLMDTRTTSPMIANSTLNLNVGTTATGASSGVPSNATAVALNVTVTDTTDSGYLSVYPTGGTQPYVSNLNWVMGETVANSVIVPIGTGSSVTFYNHTGNTDVVVDLEGYFAPPSGGSTAGLYVPLTPSRIDTGTTLAAGATTNVQVTGVGGVPAGATGAILNVTATDTTAASYATVYPEGATRPTASNLNWPAGGTVANRVLASLSSTGAVTIYNYTGSADLIVDVSGYFTNGTALAPSNASVYTAITPTRLLDTRVSGGTLGAGSIDTQQISGQGGIASDATAGVLNVTAVDTTAASYFKVYPAGGATPPTSDVNWMAGQIVPNLTVATLGTTGAIDVYNYVGSANLVIDAFGYFSPFVTPVVSVTSNYSSIAEQSTLAVGAVGTTAATITATVTLPSGSTNTTDSVVFSESGAACGGFGTSGTPTSSFTTGAAAVSPGVGTNFTAQYNAGTSTGNCLITATETDLGQSASTTVTQTTAANSISFAEPSYSVAVGSGVHSTLLAVTVAAVAGSNPANDTVSVAGVGTCGTFYPASEPTGANTSTDTVDFGYGPSGTAGFCTVTATEATTGSTATAVIDQYITTSGSYTVAVAADPTSILANGTSTSTITATVTNALGNPVSGDQVIFSDNGANACGTLPSGAVTTGTAGTATVTYTSNTTAGTCAITAQEAEAASSSTAVTVTQTSTTTASTLTVSPASASFVTGSDTHGNFIVTLQNAGGTGIANQTVTYSDNTSPSGVCGDIAPASGTTQTGTAGTASFTYYATGLYNGACDITFTADGVSGTATVVNYGGATAPVASAPTVTSVSPNLGPTGGGTTVTIGGSGFVAGATTVAFGTAAATSVSVGGANTLTATAPAGTGTVNVTVTTAAGTSALSSADAYTYATPTMVSAVTSSSGIGTSFTITVDYNMPVTCASTVGTQFSWLDSTTGNVSNGDFTCSAAGSTTLVLTGTLANGYGSAGVGAELTYTAPGSNSVSGSVYAGPAAIPTYALTQTLSGSSIS